MIFSKFSSKIDMVRNDVFGAPKVAPSADRDVSYPREPMWGTTIPQDINLVDDNSDLIKNIQQSLKSGILGIKYNGPVDGNINSSLTTAIYQLESLLEKKFPDKKFRGSIMFGQLLSGGGWNKAMKAISQLNEVKDNSLKDEDKKSQPENEAEIKKFQKLFGLQETGLIDDNLIKSAINIENQLSEKLSEPAIKGMIWNPNTKSFQTSAQDVSQALKIIQENLKNM